MNVESIAYEYAARGWRVIPIREGFKKPPFNKWQDVATTDQKRIHSWFGGLYSNAGIGIATGQESGVWVLDVDPGHGGLETLQTLSAEHGPLPKGPRCNTGGDGFHQYYHNPKGLHVATTKNVAGSGLDVRGDGGQVLAPPSKHAHLACAACLAFEPHELLDYRWAPGRNPAECELPDAPQWLLDLVVPTRNPNPPSTQMQAPATQFDQSDSAAEAINREHTWHDLLESDGWTQSRGSGGDTLWTRPGKDPRAGVSGTLHEPDGPFVNFSTSAELLCQPWARSTNGDGWAYSIFGYIAATRHGGDRSATAREWRRQRTSDDQADWAATVSTPTLSPLAPADADPEDLSWAHLVDWGDFWARDHAIQEWIVWPLIPKGRAVALFAAAKAGKSTIVLAALAAAACGRKVLGTWDTEPVSILYLDFEMTEADIWERLDQLGYGPEVDMSNLHYAMLPSIFPLDTVQGAAQILALAKSVRAEVVVIDTFSRAVKGDENDADTSRDFYRYTGMSLKAESIAVLRTDHAGKSVEQGQRGSSAKNDDVDVVWSLERTNAGVLVKRTHSRVSWVPEEVAIQPVEHDDGTMMYTIVNGHQWSVRAAQIGQALLDLCLPVDASERQAKATYIACHHDKPLNREIGEALAWMRAQVALDGWSEEDT